MLHINYSQY